MTEQSETKFALGPKCQQTLTFPKNNCDFSDVAETCFAVLLVRVRGVEVVVSQYPLVSSYKRMSINVTTQWLCACYVVGFLVIRAEFPSPFSYKSIIVPSLYA